MRLLFLCPHANSHAFGSSRLPKEGAVDNRLRKRAPCGARLLDTASMTGGRLGDRTTRPFGATAFVVSLGVTLALIVRYMRKTFCLPSVLLAHVAAGATSVVPRHRVDRSGHL